MCRIAAASANSAPICVLLDVTCSEAQSFRTSTFRVPGCKGRAQRCAHGTLASTTVLIDESTVVGSAMQAYCIKISAATHVTLRQPTRGVALAGAGDACH